MNSHPSFFKTLVQSCISPSFYKYLLEQPFAHAWKYYIKLYCCIALIITIVFCVVLSLFNFQSFAAKTYTELLAAYPDELEVTVEPGKYTINQDLPYFVPMPPVLQEASVIPYRYALVFSSNELVSMGNVADYNAPIVLTEDRMYTVEHDGVRIKYFGDTLNDIDTTFTVSEQLLLSFPITAITNSWWSSRLLYVPVFGLLFFICATLFLLLWNSFKLLIATFFAWLLYLVFAPRLKFDYGDVLHISLYAITPIILLKALTTFMLPIGGFLWFAMYLVWMLIIAKTLLKPEETVPKHVLQKSTIKNSSKKSPESTATIAKKPTRTVAIVSNSKKSSEPEEASVSKVTSKKSPTSKAGSNTRSKTSTSTTKSIPKKPASTKNVAALPSKSSSSKSTGAKKRTAKKSTGSKKTSKATAKKSSTSAAKVVKTSKTRTAAKKDSSTKKKTVTTKKAQAPNKVKSKKK